MFRDLEVAVSGLELLHELRQDAVINSRGSGPAQEPAKELQRKGGADGGRETTMADIGRLTSERPNSLGVASVADQLTRWRDLCDEALLKINP